MKTLNIILLMMAILYHLAVAKESKISSNDVDYISFPTERMTVFTGSVPYPTEGLHAFCEWRYTDECKWADSTYVNETRMLCSLNQDQLEIVHAVVNCETVIEEDHLYVIQGSCIVELHVQEAQPTPTTPSWSGIPRSVQQPKKEGEERRFDRIVRRVGRDLQVQIPTRHYPISIAYCRFNVTKTEEAIRTWSMWLSQTYHNTIAQVHHAYDQIPTLAQLWKDVSRPIDNDAERAAAAYRIGVACLTCIVVVIMGSILLGISYASPVSILFLLFFGGIFIRDTWDTTLFGGIMGSLLLAGSFLRCLTHK